jgi:hypothetical protein
MLRAALKMTMRWTVGGILLEEKTEVAGGKQPHLEFIYQKSKMD